MGYMLLKEKAGFMSLIIICTVFSIYLINPVAAEETIPDTSENKGCCERTNSGESCRYTNVDNCDTEYIVGNFQRCEDSAFCKPGCCISPDGSCSKQVSKATCENEGRGYIWNADATCSIEKCQKGCCVLGGVECKYTTQKRCAGITADFEGLALDFRKDVATERECTEVCKEQDDGCCVKSDGICTRTTRVMCGLEDGTGSDGFYKDVFCSKENLRCEPKCTEKAKMDCVEGSEDVYWFDSCGNREGIVTETIEGSGNTQKNGDCDYARGTICSGPDKNHKTAYCKNVNCNNTTDYEQINYDGVKRYNGENWCVYDTRPGPGMDTVGSRHWRHICINGEEIVEPCKDYREEYCTQTASAQSLPQKGKRYMESGCVTNNAKSCVTECNTAKEEQDASVFRIKTIEDKACCERENKNCIWQWLDKKNETGLCLPGIPLGLRFWEEENETSKEAKELCNTQSHNIKTGWQHNVTGCNELICIDNCEAYTNVTLRVNSLLCNTIGDCGAKYNYIGIWNNDGFFRELEGVEDSAMAKFCMSIGSEVGSMQQISNAITKNKPNRTMGVSDIIEGYNYTSLRQVGIGIYNGSTSYNATQQIESIGSGDLFGNLKAAGGAMMGVAAIAGMLAGSLIVPVVLMIIGLILLFADTGIKQKAVFLNCELWQPPVGGEDCGKCDNETLHQCSEYRCRSLGQNCRFIFENEGTEKGTCYAEYANDVVRPQIEAWTNEDYLLGLWKSKNGKKEYMNEDYELEIEYSSPSMQSGYLVKKAVPSFSTIEFGIKTDKPSQCKYSTKFDKDATFGKAENWFVDSYYTQNHNITLYGIFPNKTYEFYIICRSPGGYPKEDEHVPQYKISFSTSDSPDFEPPYIISTLPANNDIVGADGNLTLIAYVDEPSGLMCRVSQQDVDFGMMKKNMVCMSETQGSSIEGNSMCFADLGPMMETSNSFYLGCNDSNGNVMQENYKITVIKSKKLFIKGISPKSGASFYVQNVTLAAETEGGAYDGRAICAYAGSPLSGEFYATNQTLHRQALRGLAKGNYSLTVTCHDDAGNEASATTSFFVDVDLQPPCITSIYKSEGSISVSFDEPVSCQFSNSSFVYGFGTQAPSEVTEAVFPAGAGKVYINCIDSFGNPMPELSADAME